MRFRARTWLLLSLLLFAAAYWTPLMTNHFDANGGFSFTEAYSPTNAQQFFTIEQP